MGEIADMMLEGAMCQWCGEFIDGGGEGFPTICSGCQRQNGVNAFGAPAKKRRRKKKRRGEARAESAGEAK